ncbi:hypothetical protein JOL62DRAFT_560758 [Phyllosticta paracitricarpa]|uniref:Uncharacterized protein n=1 Tax=Phyllosticta paracitricarpa TaxID=2016321 RepID=A0ABR1MS69_9PEZI
MFNTGLAAWKMPSGAPLAFTTATDLAFSGRCVAPDCISGRRNEAIIRHCYIKVNNLSISIFTKPLKTPSNRDSFFTKENFKTTIALLPINNKILSLILYLVISYLAFYLNKYYLFLSIGKNLEVGKKGNRRPKVKSIISLYTNKEKVRRKRRLGIYIGILKLPIYIRTKDLEIITIIYILVLRKKKVDNKISRINKINITITRIYKLNIEVYSISIVIKNKAYYIERGIEAYIILLVRDYLNTYSYKGYYSFSVAKSNTYIKGRIDKI